MKWPVNKRARGEVRNSADFKQIDAAIIQLLYTPIFKLNKARIELTSCFLLGLQLDGIIWPIPG